VCTHTRLFVEKNHEPLLGVAPREPPLCLKSHTFLADLAKVFLFLEHLPCAHNHTHQNADSYTPKHTLTHTKTHTHTHPNAHSYTPKCTLDTHPNAHSYTPIRTLTHMYAYVYTLTC
jgi:hypothetical protein